MRNNRALSHHEQGAAALEMALVLPFMLLLLFGIVDMGRFYWAQHTVVHATNEAARLAMLEGVTDEEVSNVVAFHMRDWGDTYDLDIDRNIPADIVTVTISMPFSFMVLPNLVTGAFFTPLTIRHSVTMQLEW